MGLTIEKAPTGPIAGDPGSGQVTDVAFRLFRSEQFSEAQNFAAKELMAIHQAHPREVHYVADLNRWRMTQEMLALHLEHAISPQAPAISHSNLVKVLAHSAVASRNTVHAFLLEMHRLKLIEPVPSHDRRHRTYRASDLTERLIRAYFDLHLRSLDMIDDGARHIIFRSNPELLAPVQANFAALLRDQAGWYAPSPQIYHFVRSNSGNSVLHHVVSAATWSDDFAGERVSIGPLSVTDLAERYQMSRTHAGRLMSLATAAGLVGLDGSGSTRQWWISIELVREYRLWQAYKFAALSCAFDHVAAGETPST